MYLDNANNGALAHVMTERIQTATEGKYRELRTMLKGYGEHGFYDTDVAIRTKIKMLLNTLLLETLKGTDVIITTVAAAAKVNLATTFTPAVVYIDEAARLTEFKTLIPFGSYEPVAFILAGDHKQMRLIVLSADRHRDNPPFVNPFQNQVLLSIFKRLVSTSQEHHMLTVQHRYKGSISN